MSDHWSEFRSRVEPWYRANDRERIALAEIHYEAFQFQETDPEASFAIFTRARDEARRLREPWFVLFYENWRLAALTSYVMDFTRALPLAIELMVLFNQPEAEGHSEKISVYLNVLYTYTNIDPLGFHDELERGFAYVDGEIPKDSTSNRFVLHHRWMSYFNAVERWDDAREVAMRSLALLDRTNDEGERNWHGAWTLCELCEICHGLGRLDELAEHAQRMAEISAKTGQLRRTQADAAVWLALTLRVKGREKEARQSFRRGLSYLRGLERRDTAAADAIVAYYEAGREWDAAVEVRAREFAYLTRCGMHHRACQIQIDRCRLLSLAGRLTAADIQAARESAAPLRAAGRLIERLDQLAPST